MGRPPGRSSRSSEEIIAFNARMEALALGRSRNYQGRAILLAPASGIAKNLGVPLPAIYSPRTNYPAVMAACTGLVVIHNGIVLGEPIGVSGGTSENGVPPQPTISPIEQIAQGLSKEALGATIGRLAAQLANR